MDIMLTLEWVSPKWGSMVKSIVVGSKKPLTSLYVYIQAYNKEFLIT